MGKNLSLLKPVVKSTYLKNRVMEKVTYIDVPEDIGLKELRSDIKNGAVHMKELEGLVTKKKEPRYIVINAENEEQGYMAVSYLASCFAKKHRADSKEWYGEISVNDTPEYIQEQDPEEEECWSSGENWEESLYRIPVLTTDYLQQSMPGNNNLFSPFPDGNFMTGATGKSCSHEPFWRSCTTHSVCILMMNRMDIFSMGCNDSALFEALEFFGGNDKVCFLNIQEPVCGLPAWLGNEDENEEECGETMVVVNATKNQVVLTFAADEAGVKMPGKGETKRYYTNIFRSWFTLKGMKAKKGFRYDPIINVIMAMTSDKVCEMIEKIIRYAVKDEETTKGLVLSNDDFTFVDRFVRVYRKGAEKDKAAKVRLEKELVGMDEIKQQVRDVVNIMKFNRIRNGMGLRGSQYHNVHMMLGAPGTAKTTVAKLMGQIMVEEGLLHDNRFACVNGAELKGMYVGHSAPKTKSLFDNNDIIVIDEAYSLVSSRGENDSFSNEALAQLVIELENHADDRLVIFAGYGGRDVSERDNRMKLFLDSNPGIKSRINSTFYFASYEADEMVEIFKRIAANESYRIEDGADIELQTYFERRRRDQSFGNGREARSLLEASVLEMSKRVLENKTLEKLTKNDVRLILAEDVRKAIVRAEKANRIQYGRESRQIGFGKQGAKNS